MMECQTLPTTKCVLCLRPTEKMSDENICRQQKIADVYMTYLKPKLAKTAASDIWANLVKKPTSDCQFCSDCMSAGQNLMSMNDQLSTLQCAIQDFVQKLSEEILKYRDELDTRPHQPVDSVPPNPQKFSNDLAHELEVKKEGVIIKQEVEIESICMDVGGNISNQASVSKYPVGDHVQSNGATCVKVHASSDITGETSGLTNGNESSLENNTISRKRKKLKKDVLKNIHPRKRVGSLRPQCGKCDTICLDQAALLMHLVSVHPKKKFAFCAVCPDLEKFTDRHEYEMHIMTHTEEIPYDCPKCPENFSNAKDYCEHQTSSDCANSDGQFVCTKCDKKFKAKCLLLTHTTVFHKPDETNDYSLLQCDMCERLPMLQCNLEDHYAEHMEEFIIPCDICGMSLQNLAKFDEHRKSHRSSVGIPYSTFDKALLEEDDDDAIEYICENCNKKFIDETKRYLSHIQKCQCNSLPHVCDICGKKFSYPDRLANHMKGHVDGFPTCTKCNQQFETEAKLKAHVKKRKSPEDECEVPPVAAKKRKLNKNESSKLEQNSKNEQDMDIDGNEIKSIPSKSTKAKKREVDNELNVAIEQQISKILSGETISVDADENHVCTLCSEKFSDLNSLESHMFKEHKETTVKCSHCEEIFLNNKDKGRHAKSAHPRNDLVCAACPDLEKFSNVYEWEVHCLTHTEEIPYDCPICHEKFSNTKNYCEHQKSSACANSGAQFECAKCEVVFKAKCLLLTHMTVFHKGKGREKKEYALFQCEVCEKPPMQKFHLEDHYADHTKEFIIPCDICGMRLQSLAILNVHRKSHRPTVIAIPCISCDEKFKNLLLLRSHIKMMHTEGQVVTEDTCERCGKKFVGKPEKYRRHVETCSKFLICDICKKKFSYPDRLANHMKGHTEGFPTCKICDQQFESDAKLKAHSDKIHSLKQTVIDEPCGETSMSKAAPEEQVKEKNSQNEECDVCGEKISGKMKKHKQLVHKLELVPCEYCPEMFPTPGAQRKHEDSKHWEVRNKDFQCSGCETVFKQEKQLGKHEKLMHPELQSTNNQCPLCKKVLHDASGLKAHMHSKHENVVDKYGALVNL